MSEGPCQSQPECTWKNESAAISIPAIMTRGVVIHESKWMANHNPQWYWSGNEETDSVYGWRHALSLMLTKKEEKERKVKVSVRTVVVSLSQCLLNSKSYNHFFLSVSGLAKMNRLGQYSQRFQMIQALSLLNSTRVVLLFDFSCFFFPADPPKFCPAQRRNNG